MKFIEIEVISIRSPQRPLVSSIREKVFLNTDYIVFHTKQKNQYLVFTNTDVFLLDEKNFKKLEL